MFKPRAVLALVTVLAAIVPIADRAQAEVEPDSIIKDVYDYPDDEGLLDAIDYGAGAVYELNSGGEISRRTGATSTVVAGGGDSTADGVAATSAKIVTYDFVVAPDGTIYFADQTLLKVRKISPAGIITTVAGNGSGAASGDGGPALNAGMTPESVAIDTAGNLLIADGGFAFTGGPQPNPGNNRLRRVDPSGTITTLTTFDPTENEWTTPVKVRVDDSGNAYVLLVQPGGGIGAGGPMVKVTSSGTKSFVGDRFYNRDFDVAPDGTVFFGSTMYLNSELFTVAPDGTVTTLNESSLMTEPDFSPKPVSEALVFPIALALDPQGNLYLIDAYDGRLRVVVNDEPLPAAESVQPARILDTRPGAEQTGYTGDKPAAGQTVSLQVAGRGGVPASGAAAVTMNIVITEASDAGFVTVWPSGQTRPLASSLNAKGPGDTVANLVTVPVGPDGKVNLFTQTGGHLLADVSGWLPAGTYVPKTPTRILDTRPGTEQVGYTGDKPGAGATVDLQVTGVAGIPTSGVAAVTMNVTATEASNPGFVTIWPQGQTRPNASSLNLDAIGATAPNQVTVPVGATGKVSLYTQTGTHLIADIVGYYNVSTGYTPLVPSRILDTRPGAEQTGYTGDKPAAGQTVSMQVAGRGGVPASGAGAVILNVTATEASAPGFISAWPGGTTRPNASILNLTYAGQTRPNAVVVPIGADGKVNLFTQTGTHLVVDVSGWFPG